MDDDTRSKDLTLPEDEPWMSHGFISKIAAQVSLPYRRPKDGVKEIERRNGSLVVRYVSGADCLPYGKYPRLFELWACTMIKTNDPCFDPWENHGPDGYQPPSYEPVNPERRTAQTPSDGLI